LLLLVLWLPRVLISPIFQTLSFNVLRARNAFCHYIFKTEPVFYYLEAEKNGEDVHISREKPLKITYQDEFVIKSVVSDDLTGKHTSIKFQGYSKTNNDLGILMKGVDFINAVIKGGTLIGQSGIVRGYYITVQYKGKVIGSVPLEIIVTPQDWLRFAKESSDIKQQIEYLKKAIALNSDDIGVRKILAGVYLRLGNTDDAMALYHEVLKIKPDDAVALEELAKCYLLKKDLQSAENISQKLVKINPQDARAFAVRGMILAEKGLWEQAAQNFREAVRFEPDNEFIRFQLAETYKKSNMLSSALEEYKYLIQSSQQPEQAYLALGDIYLQQKNIPMP